MDNAHRNVSINKVVRNAYVVRVLFVLFFLVRDNAVGRALFSTESKGRAVVGRYLKIPLM